MSIDAHHHFWRYDPAQYGWISESMAVLRQDYLPPQLRKATQAAGVDGVVSVQARQSLAETDWLLELADQHEFIRGVVGWVPLVSEQVRRDLERLRGRKKLKGVRHVLQDEPDDNYMLRDDFNRGIRQLKEFALGYDVLVFERHLPQTILFVDRHPEQVFVLDHVAKPRIRDNLMSPWRENLRELARRPNVWCKLSGVVTEADHRSWTPQQLRPYMETVLEAFGPRRLMFGSDWPVCLLACGYQRWYQIVREFASALSPDEQSWLFGRTATDAYDLYSGQRPPRGFGGQCPPYLRSDMKLPKYSMGIGDRFARQGKAQLAAFVRANQMGIEVAPVWNKSNREHLIVHSTPESVRREADAAVNTLDWTGPYFVDADHIGLKTVDAFVPWSDFFTIDVADSIGKPAADPDIRAFVDECGRFAGSLLISGIDRPLEVSKSRIESIARKYLLAVQEAGKIYRHIEAAKGKSNFVAEVSMDETDQPQTPVELLFILAALSHERVPVQTIAPKFTGRFNKGVDYVGDIAQFEKEFNDDLAVIAFAIQTFELPEALKLSVHSGSDKFSIYAPIRRAIRRHNAGLHLKTAGTTWLEELIGLASAGGDGLYIAKDTYAQALERVDELCGPYASVIDIDRTKLPSPREVAKWSGDEFAAAVRHDPSDRRYNPNLRQLLHVGYKVAAQMGERYIGALESYESIIAKNVTENLFERHLKPIFIGIERAR